MRIRLTGSRSSVGAIRADAERRARWRITAGASSAAALLFVACGRDAAREAAPLAIDARMVPPVRVTLRADRDVPLEFNQLASFDDSTLVGVERRTRDLWTIPLRPGGEPRRQANSGTGRRRIVGLAAADGHVAMLDLLGRVSEDVPGAIDPLLVAHRRFDGSRGALGFARLTDGSFVILEARTSVTRGTWEPADTVELTRVIPPDTQATIARWTRSGARHPLGIATDLLALRVVGDTVVVSGSAPPRAVRFTVGTAVTADSTTFSGITPVAMSERDARALQATLARRRVPAEVIARLPMVYPPVASAVSVDGVWFIVLPLGADRFGLAHTCGNQPVRGVLGGANITAIFLLDRHVVVVRDESDAGNTVLEVSSYRDFDTPCRR